MSRRALRTPKYCLHKRSGHAYVRINGKQTFLGKYGTDESLEKYRRFVAEWRTDDTPVSSIGSRLSDITILELINLYYQHAKKYYVKNGVPTDTVKRLKPALKLLKQHYGWTPAAEFGPKRLKALRQIMIDTGNSRSYINDNVRRICQMFRWGSARSCCHRRFTSHCAPSLDYGVDTARREKRHQSSQSTMKRWPKRFRSCRLSSRIWFGFSG